MGEVFFPLQDRLLFYVHTPMELGYLALLFPQLNRSVVLLCNFDVADTGIHIPDSINSIELCSTDIKLYEDEEMEQFFPERYAYINNVKCFLFLLRPEGIVMVGGNPEENVWIDFSKESRISILQLCDSYSDKIWSSPFDRRITWKDIGCMLPSSSDDKKNIIAIYLQNRDARYEANLWRLVRQVQELYSEAQIGVLYYKKQELSEELCNKIKSLPRVRLLKAYA